VADDVLDNLSVTDRANRWVDILAASDSDSTTLVDADGDIVHGFVSVGPCRDEERAANTAWEIYAIYIDPVFQRRGYGEALLRAALARVPKAVSRMTLWVLADNVGARRFYESLGFHIDGTTKSVQIGQNSLPEVRYEFLR
jgi:ribosomal protein S18 acetylase RimI-like enzyme